MRDSITKQAMNYLRAQKNHRAWLSVFLCLAILVSTGTTAALTLPGITMTEETSVLSVNPDLAAEEVAPAAEPEPLTIVVEEPVSGVEEPAEEAVASIPDDPQAAEEITEEPIEEAVETDGPQTEEPLEESEEPVKDEELTEETGQEIKETSVSVTVPVSDTEADVEDAGDWYVMFLNVRLTGDWNEDLVTIAKTQLGYTESTRNTHVNDNGFTSGYTRYGAWYGDPYGDWCAMFVSFCLEYAKIPAAAVPRESGVTRWIDALSARGLYTAAGGYTPKIGDIVFLNLIGDEMADHVGIVTEVRSDGIQTIEGNCDDAVQYMNYTFDGEEILGYGVLPEEPDDELAEELIEASAAAAEPEENEEENEKQVFFLEDPIEEAVEEETEADASDSLRDGNEPAEEPLNIAGAVSAADERLALSAEAIGPDADGLLRYTIVVSSETGTENPVRVKSEMDGVAYWNDLAVLDQDGNEVAIQDGTVYAGATAFDFALRTMAAGDVYTLCFTAKLQETADPAQIGNAISVRSFFGAENLSHELYLDPNSRVELEPVVEEAAEKSAEIENAAEDELPMQYERSLEVAGADYMLQVQYDDASGIPEDADFVFDTLTAGEAYEYYAAQALEAVSGESGRVGLLGMFDLSIYDGEGNSLQPEAPVKVRVAFDEALAAGMKVYAVHFPGTGTVEAQPAQSEITEHAVSTPRRAMSSGRANLEVIEATNENGVASFEASGFSVYAMVFTVDFSYEKDGQTYQYSLEGGSKVMLSQLFDVLGVEYAFGTAADVLTGAALVDNVSDVVFSDESLVAVTAVSGDWELESLEAFRTSETLTITMTDGGKIVIQVTDAQIPVAGHGNGKITVSKNMEYLDGMNRLSSGKIQFALMKDGEWVRSPWDSSKPYVVEMNIQGDGLQPSTQTFTGLEDGEYDVWEVHGDVNNDIIKRSYDGMMLNNDTVEIDSIRVVYNSNGQQNANGLYNNNATIKDGSEASMTFRNIYKPTSGKTSFEVNKVWMDRKENIIQAPEGAVIAFTLYQEVNGVTSDTGKTIVLDGVADKEGESNPWQAVFSDLPTKTADGQTIRYKVRETSGWPDYYVCKNKGKNLMRDNEYLETSGGTIYNRHLLATIQIQKHFDIQPNKYSAADWAEVLAKKQLSFELTNETTHETWYFTLDDSFSQSGQLFYLDVPNMQAGHYVLKEYRYKGLITDRKWDRGVTIYERDINPGDNMDNPLFEMQVQNWYVDGQDEPEGAYFKALKVWDDLDDFDEIRPESVTVRLQATVNGQEYALPSTISNPITLSEENEWNTGSAWYDLPIVDNNGNTIEYTVVEENVPEGYTCETTVSENGTDKSYTFTNTHRPQGSGTIKLKKVVDAPAGVEIPNTYYFVITDSEGQFWTGHSVSGPEGHYTAIPISINSATGEEEIEVPVGKYTIEEIKSGIEIAGYTLTVTGEGTVVVKANQNEEVVITNHYEEQLPDGGIRVIKKWEDQDGKELSDVSDSATVQLQRYHYAAEGGSTPSTKTVSVTISFPGAGADWNMPSSKTVTEQIAGNIATVTISDTGGIHYFFDANHTKSLASNQVLVDFTNTSSITFYATETWASANNVNSITILGENVSEPTYSLEKDTAFAPATQTLSSSFPSHTWVIGDGSNADFPAKDANGKDYLYYIVELDENGNEVAIGEEVSSGVTLKSIEYEPGKTENAGIKTGVITVTNTKETSDETGSVQVTKTFTGIEVSEIPADFQITASWTEDGAEKTAEFTTTDKQPDADSENLTYTWTISDLPIGTEVTFTETDYELDGYIVQTTPPANTEDGKVTTKATATAAEPGTASFENAYTKDAHIDIVIKKVNDKNEEIGGAVFELYRLNNESIHEKMTQSTYSWLDSNNRFTVPTSGFTLEGLEDGTYQIVEVTPPAGYVITVSDPVTFTVTNGEVVSGSNVLKNRAAYTAATETEKDTYTIVNTPGVSLPNTGGSGTLAYTLGGGLLSLTAGLFLALRLRRREETA